MEYNDEPENEVEEQSAELQEVHSEALNIFNNIQSTLRDERQQCLEDRRFYSIAGAQWEGDLEKYYENKTKIEINKIHLAVIRIINEYRNNRITVDFTSKDGKDPADLSSVCDGLYRADEQDCNANEAYDNAFEEAVGGGFGAWRLRAAYEDEYDDEDERQRIEIEPIYDADSCVFFDLNAKRQDKRDAKHCYVLTSMTHEEYKDEWGELPASMPKSVEDTEFDWNTEDAVYIAEYYKVELVKETIRVFEDINGKEERYSSEDFKNNENLETELFATGYKEIRQKKVRKQKVHKYIMAGNIILEDCGYIAGNRIPIVPMFAKRWYVDNVERCMGHVRLARDAQILKNIQVSKLAEISSLSPIEKPIFAPEQIAGNEQYWQEDNTENYPFMLVNPIEGANGNEIPAGPLGYTKPPQVPPALGALLGLTEQDMKELLGNDQALEQVNMNLSGEAIGKLQDRLDMQTFIYVSNMVKAMQCCGEIWLSMAKEIYVEDKREMKIVSQNQEANYITLNEPTMDAESSELVYKNDLSNAKMHINVEVGPATSSKKQATVRNLIQAVQVTTDPATQGVLGNLILMNMEGEGVTDAARWSRRQLVAQGVIEPTEEEAKEMAAAAQNQQPNPQDVYLQAEAEKSRASAAKIEAETVETLADTEKTKAETVETIAGIERADEEQALRTLQGINQTIAENQTPTQQGVPNMVSVPPQTG